MFDMAIVLQPFYLGKSLEIHYCPMYISIIVSLQFYLQFCYLNRERLRCNGIIIISIVYSSPLLVLRLQHMGKHFPLSLLTPYLKCSQEQNSAPMWGAYWLIYPL